MDELVELIDFSWFLGVHQIARGVRKVLDFLLPRNDPVGLPEPQVSVYSLHDVRRVAIYKSFIILLSLLYSAVGGELE